MTEATRWGTAATARRVAALQARAAHPATPPAEAETCRRLLAQLLPATSPATCTCCRCRTTVYAAAGWRRVVCGAWASA